MSSRVVDNREAGRYEIHVGGAVAGFAEYRARPGVIVFVHTEIDPAYGGHGLGTTLAAAALDDVRRRGQRVAALCPFIAAYVNRHPEYADLAVLPDASGSPQRNAKPAMKPDPSPRDLR